MGIVFDHQLSEVPSGHSTFWDTNMTIDIETLPKSPTIFSFFCAQIACNFLLIGDKWYSSSTSSDVHPETCKCNPSVTSLPNPGKIDHLGRSFAFLFPLIYFSFTCFLLFVINLLYPPKQNILIRGLNISTISKKVFCVIWYIYSIIFTN